MRGEDNIEAPSNVIAYWLEDEQPRIRMDRYGAAQMPTTEMFALSLSRGLPGENEVCCPSALITIWRCAGIVICAHPATYVGARRGSDQGHSFEGDPRAERERNRSSAKALAEL